LITSRGHASIKKLGLDGVIMDEKGMSLSQKGLRIRFSIFTTN